MPDRRGKRGSIEDLLPVDRRTWAREIWADREVVAGIDGGAWMLRNAAETLGLDQELVDELLRRQVRD